MTHQNLRHEAHFRDYNLFTLQVSCKISTQWLSSGRRMTATCNKNVLVDPEIQSDELR